MFQLGSDKRFIIQNNEQHIHPKAKLVPLIEHSIKFWHSHTLYGSVCLSMRPFHEQQMNCNYLYHTHWNVHHLDFHFVFPFAFLYFFRTNNETQLELRLFSCSLPLTKCLNISFKNLLKITAKTESTPHTHTHSELYWFWMSIFWFLFSNFLI